MTVFRHWLSKATPISMLLNLSMFLYFMAKTSHAATSRPTITFNSGENTPLSISVPKDSSDCIGKMIAFQSMAPPVRPRRQKHSLLANFQSLCGSRNNNLRASNWQHRLHPHRRLDNFPHQLREQNDDLSTMEVEFSQEFSILQAGDEVDYELRFSGVGRLFSNKKNAIKSTPYDKTEPESPSKTPPSSSQETNTVLNRLSEATVAIIGLGGVGSWAAEALCRSGIGHLILVDLDDICISNTNRQLHATSSTVGKLKIEEVKRRLVDINPGCNVTLVHDFVTVNNSQSIIQSLQPEVTVVIDAIDGMYEKTALILSCVNLGIPIVTCGGAAGRSDPTQIVVGDLTEVKEDRLLFHCRKELRQQHGFPKVPVPGSGKKTRVRKWRIPSVYSMEVQRAVGSQSGEEEVASSSFRRCDGALGTACFVTGTYGFVAASKVVDMIATDKLTVPKRWKK